MVPANRAIIGMGASGGFPDHVGDRWGNETGLNPPPWARDDDVAACWYTALERHPLAFRLFPPVNRPSDSATLQARVLLCEVIQVPNGEAIKRFLLHCSEDDPAAGGHSLGFRIWDRARGLPRGFTPIEASPALQPTLTRRNNSYFDVRIDLRDAAQMPIGYYAIIECGWDERGDHSLQEYDVTFEAVKAVAVDDIRWDDWHMYYGVNGQWEAWWTDDFIEEGKTYTHNRTFRVWTVDDMPIVLRDCGIEWEGWDGINQELDRVEITAAGPDHFDAILDHVGVQRISQSANRLQFKARGWEIEPKDTQHEWTITIVRRQRV